MSAGYKQFLGIVCGILSAFSFSGCIPVIIGTAAAGGYVASNDAADAFLECSYEQAWESAYGTLSELGKITYFKQSSGVMKGLVDNAVVRVRIISSNAASQRVVVSARKTMLPAPKIAQRLFLAIYYKIKVAGEGGSKE